MRCNRVGHLLPDYLDGDLVGRLNQAVSDHLDGCERCRRELAAQQRVHRILDTGRPPVTIDLWADFSRRLQAQSSPRPSPWRSLWQPGLATALAVAVIALVARTAPVPAFAPPDVSPPDLAVKVARVPVPEAIEREVGRVIPLQHPVSPLGAQTIEARRPAPHSALPRFRAKRPVFIADQTALGERHRGARRFGRNVTARVHPRPTSTPSWLTVASRPELPDMKQMASPFRADELAHGTQGAASADPPAASSNAPASHPQPNAAHPHPGDPLQIAEALATVQQDAASDQMGGELLRLAREVARVGGEPIPAERSGTESAAHAAESSAATGT